MKRFILTLAAILIGASTGAVQLDLPASASASGNGAGDVVMTLNPTEATAAGVYDCDPGGHSIEPWQTFSSSGVVRGAGTFCGENLWNEYSVYAWDKASDSGCVAIWVKYDTHSYFTKIQNTEACGIDIVRWQLYGMAEYDQVRVVWGNFAAYKIIKNA